MANPWYETVRVEHPNIPDSAHDVPKDSLVIMQRSGWVVAQQAPEDEVKPEEVTAEAQELEKQEAAKAEADKPEETKANTKTSSRRAASSKEES